MKLNLSSLKAKFLQIFLLLFSIIAFAQTTKVIPLTTSSSGVWTVPCGVTSITVEAWGAGGGGGRRTSNGATGGGGGGAYVRAENVSVSMGTSFGFHVGVGGDGSTDTAVSNSGENTWFGSATYLMAKGGTGVGINSENGGAGGSGPASIVPLGIIKYSGGNGGNTRSSKAGNGGGAAYKDNNGGNGHPSNDDGGGYSEYPGGKGARGGIYWAGDGNPGINYGGGGGGAIKSPLLSEHIGGKGADGFIQITYTVAAGNPPDISAVEAISKNTTDIGCVNNQVTLQASGGETGIGVSTLWSKGTVCPEFPFIEEFMGDNYDLTGADVGAGSGGNKIFTATSATPSINEMILPSFDTSKFKYITIRYRNVTGVSNTAKIFFTKGNSTYEGPSATLEPDAVWHILNIEMSSKNWSGTIKKLKYQFASKINTQVEIDYIVLSNVKILENTNSDDSRITIDATDATATYGAVRIADQAALCDGQTPRTLCFSTEIERKDKRFTGTGTAWNDQNNWTFTGIPNSSNCVFINSGKNVIVNIPSAEAKSIKVESTGKITISPGNALKVTNSITNMGDGTNFIINDGGNLLQIEDGAVNTGNITAQKVFTFSTARQQYNYVSAPTVNTNVKSIYTGVLDNSLSALYYIESNDRFGISGGNYIAGRALALKEKSTGTEGGTSGNPAKFLGVPFNGTINYPLAFTNATHGYNLVGNPYPSNLDIENLYDSNAEKINATFYFWDNRGNTAFTQQGSGYNGDNYAKYNAAADTGVGSGVKARGISEANGRVPNRYVKVGTGFLVQAKSGGQTLYFNNAMRSSDNSGSGFLGKSSQDSEKDRYWLSLKTPANMEFMNAVVYFPNGNKAIGLEDTETFGGSDDIFTIVDHKKLAIQGRDEFDNSDILDLGISLFTSGIYTISIYDKEGVFANGQNIYLKDKQTGIITNLNEGSYTFTANSGESTGRFEIIYQPQTILVTNSVVKDEVVVYRDSDNFVVQAPKIIATVEVYDLSGKLITIAKANNRQAVLNASFFNKGMYVLRIKTFDGEITNKRIMK